jgi:hypothetical protein
MGPDFYYRAHKSPPLEIPEQWVYIKNVICLP